MKCKTCDCEIYGNVFEVVSNHPIDEVNGFYHKLPQECIASLKSENFKLKQERPERFADLRKIVRLEVKPTYWSGTSSDVTKDIYNILQAYDEAVEIEGLGKLLMWQQKWT
jgi:hypothetical protein